jgi:RND family efflux transporter MFP subunit
VKVSKRGGYFYLVICLLLIAMLGVTGCSKAKEVVKESEITVNTAPAQIQDLAKSMSYSGIVRGQNEVYLMPKIAARVTGIYVKAGDQVKAGQTLITLDNTDFIAGVKQAEAGLEMAQAGQRNNDLKVESAQADYERAKTLHEAGAVSNQQLELARLKYEELIAGSSQAAVSQAQAGLLAARTQLEKCTITSPINGIVGSIGLSLGDTSNPQSPAAIVSDTTQLQIEVMVSESEVSYIKEGSEVNVLVKAAQEQPYKGQVDSISSVADPTKRNYGVKIVLANPEGNIKSGMFADLKIDTLSKKNIIAIPVSGVMPKGGRDIVYTVDQDKRAREAEVKTGIKNDRFIEIVSGLEEGQEVIVKGNTLVSDGTLVRVVAGGDN